MGVYSTLKLAFKAGDEFLDKDLAETIYISSWKLGVGSIVHADLASWSKRKSALDDWLKD